MDQPITTRPKRGRLTSVERDVLMLLRNQSQCVTTANLGWVKADLMHAGAALHG
jgi:hypothetical protein